MDFSPGDHVIIHAPHGVTFDDLRGLTGTIERIGNLGAEVKLDTPHRWGHPSPMIALSWLAHTPDPHGPWVVTSFPAWPWHVEADRDLLALGKDDPAYVTFHGNDQKQQATIQVPLNEVEQWVGKRVRVTVEVW